MYHLLKSSLVVLKVTLYKIGENICKSSKKWNTKDKFVESKSKSNVKNVKV